MKLKIKEGSENYCASIVEVTELYPIEGADRIVRCVIFGNDVIVSKEVELGSKMIYFTSGVKLNKLYCTENDLLEDAEQNKNKKKGYISAKRLRVKAIKLKGVVSNGMLMPLSSLDCLDIESIKLNVGDTFTGIGEVEVCEKYIVPKKESTQKSGQKKKIRELDKVIVENQFKFHYNTAHLAKSLPKIKGEDIITITRKRHGSSLILSNILINKKLNILEKFLKAIGVKVQDQEYGFVWSSGKPKSKKPKGMVSPTNSWETTNQSFYKQDIWNRAYVQLKDKIEKGISIYGEITGAGIQGKDYTYGKEYDIHIYRITQTNVDGIDYEFSWDEVKEYCNKYNINYVEEYYVGRADSVTSVLLQQRYKKIEFDHRIFLKELQNHYLDKSFPDCKIDEGICVRKGKEVFKLKSPSFILGESKRSEEGVVDIEETN